MGMTITVVAVGLRRERVIERDEEEEEEEEEESFCTPWLRRGPHDLQKTLIARSV